MKFFEELFVLILVAVFLATSIYLLVVIVYYGM